MDKDMALPSDRATHEQSRTVSAVPVGIPSAWFHMFDAPRNGQNIILCLDETIPDVPYVRTGSFITGAYAEELGYREYAKYGGWFIAHEACSDWYVIDVDAPRGWLPMPEGVMPAQAIEARRAETGTGSVHKSAVRQDAPHTSSEPHP